MKIMNSCLKALATCVAISLITVSCSKKDSLEVLLPEKAAVIDKSGYATYTIAAGKHYSEDNGYRATSLRKLHFIARFDSSAVYTSGMPENQYDINKLYGFSDNNSHHHTNSARFGWRWSDHALRLFAYVYNNGVVFTKEIGVAGIGADLECTIRAERDAYVFEFNGAKEVLPRRAQTELAEGYKLYPYFEGDEVAPHTMRIAIREIE